MPETLERKIARLRYCGIGGTPIRPHRSLYQFAWNPGDILITLLLPLVFNLLLLLYLDEVLLLWRGIFEFWLMRLRPGTGISAGNIPIGSFLLHIPVPKLEASLPGMEIWWSTLGVCAAIFLGTFFIPPKRFLPATYILRACLLIQFTALIYFLVLPASFPYDLQSYLTDAIGMSLLFLFIVPWTIGLTYGTFDFSLLQKSVLIAVAVGYFIVALPMQYLLHALLLEQASVLFLPICYLVFGIFIDVMLFVALYAWGMSWRFGSFRFHSVTWFKWTSSCCQRYFR